MTMGLETNAAKSNSAKSNEITQELKDILNGKKPLKLKVIDYGTPEREKELKDLLSVMKENATKHEMKPDLHPTVLKKN